MNDSNLEPDLKNHTITVVIPSYNVEKEISSVIKELPDYISHIIVVNDSSQDRTKTIVESLQKSDRRIEIINLSSNQGVGGAMVAGFKRALEIDSDIVVKMDGDGQMDPKYLPELILPIINGEADYTKGNRFRDFVALLEMPLVRRLGNLALSFLTKVATGYWDCFDPTNGYLAIDCDILSLLPFAKIDKTFFFETSLLSLLYMENAVVYNIPIPALYNNSKSNLSIKRTIFEFPAKLIKATFKRVLLKYFLFDFSMISIYLVIGVPLLLFGFIFGLVKWIHFVNLSLPAPTGTVMLATLSIVVGLQLLLSAIDIDMRAVPKK